MAIQDLRQLREDINYVIKFGLTNEAVLLISILEKESKIDPNFAADQENQRLLNHLRWMCLHRLSDNEVLDLFRNHLSTIFEMEDYDLWEKFKSKLIVSIQVNDRDEFKNKIKKILQENETKITNQKIIINDNISSPTVANWIKDYNIYVGSDKFSSSEKRNEYLAYNENIKKVTKEERDRLRILFDFYDRLGLSSLSLEGYEEVMLTENQGVKGFISDGTFTKIDKKTEDKIVEMQKIIDEVTLGIKPAPSNNNTLVTTEKDDNQNERLKELMKRYKAGSLEQKAIEEELNKTEK